MKLLSFMFAVCLAVASSGVANAENPVFNTANHAWLARYDQDSVGGNKRQDVGVALQIIADGDSETRFKGKLYRYDNVKVTGNGGMAKNRYKKRSLGDGEISINGVTKPFNSNKRRKPLRFTATGSYVHSETGKVHIVVVRGIYHAGKEAAAVQRADDRLTIYLLDRPYVAKKKEKEMGGGKKDAAVNVSWTRLAFWQDMADPCDDEPDTDVLIEEPFDPATAPDGEPEYLP